MLLTRISIELSDLFTFLTYVHLQPEFSNIGYAFIRVITMMVGDISYGEAFKYLYNNQQLQNAGLTLTILVLFVIVINIAFANLLVSAYFDNMHMVLHDF